MSKHKTDPAPATVKKTSLLISLETAVVRIRKI